MVVFDVDGLFPIWYLEMEDAEEQLGTFAFWTNCFQERCGIDITPRGQVCVDVRTPIGVVDGSNRMKGNRKNTKLVWKKDALIVC